MAEALTWRAMDSRIGNQCGDGEFMFGAGYIELSIARVLMTRIVF